MTNQTTDMPICELSFPGDWTPLNQIFYSQCIQDSDEERSFCDQQKKWKRKRYPYRNEKKYRKYIIYEYVSSTESEVSSSDEFNSNENYEGQVKIVDVESHSESEVEMSDEREREHNSTNEQKGEVKIEIFSSEPEIPISESNSVDEQENNICRKQSTVKYKKYTNKNEMSSDEWEMHTSTSTDYCGSSDTSDYEVAAKKKKNQKAKGFQLSEYEEMVQRNREKNIALMKSLKLFDAKEKFKEAIKTQKPKRGEKEQNKRIILKNIENGLMEEVYEKTKAKADKKIKKVNRQSARQKSLLKKKKETFASPRAYNELLSVLPFQEALKKGYAYHDFISEVSDSNGQIPLLVENDYVSHFEKMTLQESQIISCSSISSMAVHESKEKIIICIGNGNGEIVFWHVNSDYDFCAFQLHLQKVSCLKFNPYSPNVLISSSVDGTMYHGDFEKNVFYQMFKAECCHHYDFFTPTSCLVAHGVGYVSVVDTRTHGKTYEKRHKCNEDVVKTVNLHPINKNYFISSHQRGVVKLWDLRKLQNEPVIEAHCKGKHLISSSFSPVTGDSVLVTMSDSICLLDSSSLSKEFILKESIEHNNFPMRTPIQASWLPNTDNTFVVGSKLNPRRIEIFDEKLHNIFNFADVEFNHIAVFNAFHSSLPVLASASLKRIFIFSESE